MTDLVVPESTALMGVIERAALDPNVDIDKMERLLGMQERIVAKQAEQAFTTAMCAAQSEMPMIPRDGINNQTGSAYSYFETILKRITPIYTLHGFSLSFGTGVADIEGEHRVTCDVSHREGHSKQFHLDLALDDQGIKGTKNKTAVHATGSTNSYARRYLTLMIFNLATGDDNDGQQGDDASNEIEKLVAVYKKAARHMESVMENIETVLLVKEGLLTKEYEAAAEAWFELDNETKTALWVAPTKGGCFTTEERNTIKTAGFREAFYGPAETSD